MGHLKDKYTKEYFLGSIDEKTNKSYGVAGYKSFRQGYIDKRYERFLKNLNLRGKVILDAGCGRGEAINYCAKKGAKKIIGIDFSKDAIQIASELNRSNSNVKIIELEIKNLNFKNVFDIVFMLDVIEHIPDKEMQLIYPRVYSALKRGGILILHTPIFKSVEEKDSSDLVPSTSGMHCNKQTKEKLNNDLAKYKFRKYCLNVWGRSFDRFSLLVFLYAINLSFWPFLKRWFSRISHPQRTLFGALKRIARF